MTPYRNVTKKIQILKKNNDLQSTVSSEKFVENAKETLPRMQNETFIATILMQLYNLFSTVLTYQICIADADCL